MLVLTRKSNQSIMIGDDIEVTVLSIMGEKVRIGIQAPRDIPVFRQEVYVEIQEERGEDRPPEAVSDGAGHGQPDHNGTAAEHHGTASDARAEVDAALKRLRD